MTTALSRLPLGSGPESSPEWYVGQLGENLLALVVHSADRDTIEACVASVSASLREPIVVGDAEFHLTPYAGVGILGVDASNPRVLLDHARAAAAEARRAASNNVFFFSDTLQLKSLARIDIARELRDAIASRAIRLRYTGRHDLRSGRRVAWVGLRSLAASAARRDSPIRSSCAWRRPRASRRACRAACSSTCRRTSRRFAAQSDSDVRISLGALRDHVLHEDFVSRSASFPLGRSRATRAVRAARRGEGVRRARQRRFPFAAPPRRAVRRGRGGARRRLAGRARLARRSGVCSSIAPGCPHCAATWSRTTCAARALPWPRRSVSRPSPPVSMTRRSAPPCSISAAAMGSAISTAAWTPP